MKSGLKIPSLGGMLVVVSLQALLLSFDILQKSHWTALEIIGLQLSGWNSPVLASLSDIKHKTNRQS